MAYWQATATQVVGSLPVSSSSVTSVPGPRFTGNFKNNNGFGIKLANSVVTLYDGWATVINTRSDPTSPATLAAGQTASYSSTFARHYSGWNMGVVVLEATRN